MALPSIAQTRLEYREQADQIRDLKIPLRSLKVRGFQVTGERPVFCRYQIIEHNESLVGNLTLALSSFDALDP